MRRWAPHFLLVALVTALVGFGGIDSGATSYARVIFFGAILAAVFSLAAGSKNPV